MNELYFGGAFARSFLKAIDHGCVGFDYFTRRLVLFRQAEGPLRVRKVFAQGITFLGKQKVCLHSTPLEYERRDTSFFTHILLRMEHHERILQIQDRFTPETWYIYRNPDAKVSALQRSAICIDEGSVGVKTASIRERCQNIYTPLPTDRYNSYEGALRCLIRRC